MINKQKIPFCAYSLKFLNSYFQSFKVPLLIGNLEYWFSKEKFSKGFFKFIEPCQHRLYKEGDSWAETLGWKRDLFKKVFDQIGTRYVSKTSYKKACQEGDVFRGKLYACYYDRKSNQTYFVRNHTIATNFFTYVKNSLKTNKNKPETATEHQSDIPIKARYRTTQKARCFINKDYTNNHLSTNSSKAGREVPHKEKQEKLNDMIELWKKNVGDVKKWVLNNKFSLEILSVFDKYFESSLEKWEKYCKKIASSKFLMGETKEKFKAWIQWAIKPNVIERILDDGFSFGDRKILSSPKEALAKDEDFEKFEHHYKTINVSDLDAYVKIYRQTLEKSHPFQAQAFKYKSWIYDHFLAMNFKAFLFKTLKTKGLLNGFLHDPDFLKNAVRCMVS